MLTHPVVHGADPGDAFDVVAPSLQQRYLDATTKWQQQDGAYALIQGTRPYTLARGLNDSPVGLASWIVDKFHAWSDCDGDVEKSFKAARARR